MSDDIRGMTAQLAKDPASLVYVDLAEALRRRGQMGEAAQVVLQGLARHPHHADGYDTLARIHADRGDLAQARSAWERALAIDAEHPGALKGIGFIFFRQGDLDRAGEALEHAALVNPDDPSIWRALEAVRGSAPMLSLDAAPPAPVAPAPPVTVMGSAQIEAPPVVQPDRPAAAASGAPAPAPLPPPAAVPHPPAIPDPVFAGLEGATSDILLLDARGLVLAGGVAGAAGRNVSELAAAALAGVSGEATRTADYLKLDAWTVIVAEAESANVVLAPLSEGAMLMVRRDHGTPVGLAVRITERARGAAQRWLEGHGA